MDWIGLFWTSHVCIYNINDTECVALTTLKCEMDGYMSGIHEINVNSKSKFEHGFSLLCENRKGRGKIQNPHQNRQPHMKIP